jgi:hypothetical protein
MMMTEVMARMRTINLSVKLTLAGEFTGN